MEEFRDREEQVFAEALALPAEERPRFLDQACAGDAALRQRIEALLHAHDSAGGFMTVDPLTVPAGGASAPAPPLTSAELRGTWIGRYKLLQILGEGGCGVVWMAEQEEPVRRRVALKIIKLGMDTREVIARFEAERQALAMMDHPNIAKVLDAGATDTGRPFFVMELVHGIKITEYCDKHNLDTAQRLELFSQVCHAVQHAHQKGIIHRDLKPSNILVSQHDTVPVTKVIDFGIAKAAQGHLTDRTVFTAFEQFIGTPAYMSPEQAEMSGIDIDTRSDIYSLGVLLYELLTGRPPFDPKSLLQAGLDEIRRIIREVEPPKPSTNLSTLTDPDRRNIAKLRGTDPARLSLLLRGDLDWIVMRCLEKDRARRYETANGLAADIQRHLHDQPVDARPPSSFYRVTKFVRRHRLIFVGVAALAVSLVSGFVISTWQAVRATRAERVATLEREHAVAERARAEDLFAFMLGDLRSQLAKVGRLDVLQAVGDKAMTYFASVNSADVNDTTLMRHTKALIQIGGIRMDQARYAEAIAAYAEANTRATALVARHPQDGDMLFYRGQAEYGVGSVHWKRGELDAATDWIKRYHATCVALVALDPARADWRSELAYGQQNLAVLHRDRGEFAPAREGFLEQLATLEKMLAPNPTDLELRFRVADAHSWLGALAEQQGSYPEALKQYGLQAALLEQLAQAEPRTARWRFELANTRIFQADLGRITGDLAGSGRRLKEARRLIDGLVALDPSNRDWEAASLQFRLKETLLVRQQGDLAAATRLLDDLRPQLDSLAAAEPSDHLFVLRQAMAWRVEAQLRAAAGRTDAGVAAARALQLGDTLIRENRASDSEIGEFALAGVVAGEIAAQAGEAGEARRKWQRAQDVLAPRLAGTVDWQLLDPAVRLALWSGRDEEARGLLTKLNLLGYVPQDPWPAPEQLEAFKNSKPQPQSK